MNRTKISWCDFSFSPLTGCTNHATGLDGIVHCKANCYARRLAHWRLHDRGFGYDGPAPFAPRFHLERLEEPLRQRAGKDRPHRIFVISMGDLWSEGVAWNWVENVFAVMALAQEHKFFVLTKRPERMQEQLTASVGLETVEEAVMSMAEHCGFMMYGDGFVFDGRGSNRHLYPLHSKITKEELSKRRPWPGWPLPNVALGVSICDQEDADARIPLLLNTPAAMRFVSVEPMLSAVDLRMLGLPVPVHTCQKCGEYCDGELDYSGRHAYCGGQPDPQGLSEEPSPCLDWAIAGPETGAGARPINPAWIDDLAAQCAAAGVPFFDKRPDAPLGEAWPEGW